VNISTTPSPVFADVSKKRRPASAAYACASSVGTCRRLSPCAGAAGACVVVAASSSSSAPGAPASAPGAGWTRSRLFPASAMTMFGFACRWSSFTQLFAFSSDAALVTSYTTTAACALR
jgi:hypothetical protein